MPIIPKADQADAGKKIGVQGYVSILQTEGHDARQIPILSAKNGQRYELIGLPGQAFPSAKYPTPYLKIQGEVDSSSSVRGVRAVSVRDADLLPDQATKASDVQLRSSQQGKQTGLMIVRASWTNYPNEALEFKREDFEFLSDWFNIASFGRMNWEPLTVVNLSFSKSFTCKSKEAFVKPVRDELIRRGYRLFADYRALAITVGDALFNRCGLSPSAAGYAYLGSSLSRYSEEGGLSVYRGTSAFNAYRGETKRVNKDLFIHELGHTLGADHAASMACLNGSLQYDKLFDHRFMGTRPNCIAAAYGDLWDPMGAGSGLRPRPGRPTFPEILAPIFAPVSMSSIGWLPGKESVRVPLDGGIHDVELSPFDLSGGVRVAKVQLPGSEERFGGRSPGNLWLDFRDAVGLTAPFYNFPGYSPFYFLSSTRTPKTVYLRYLPNKQIINSDLSGSPFGTGFIVPTSPQTSKQLPRFCLDQSSDEDEYIDTNWDELCAVKDGLRAGDSWSDPFGLLNIEFVENAVDGRARLRFKTPKFVQPKVQRPRIRIISRPRKRTTSRRSVFRLTLSYSSAATCRLNKRKPVKCSNGSVVFRRLRPGVHQLRISARSQRLPARPGYPENRCWADPVPAPIARLDRASPS